MIGIPSFSYFLSKVSINKPPKKGHPNLLAMASITFKGDSAGYFTIGGFSIWISKFEGQGLNVEPPKTPRFEYVVFEGGLGQKVKKEILKKYEEKGIPIIEENGSGGYTNQPG